MKYSILMLLIVTYTQKTILCAPLLLTTAPTKDTVKFMKKYGYLQDSSGPESDTLFTEEGFKAVVKEMQKYGGLNETGLMDEETLKLMETPRCGVPDVIRDDNQHFGTHNGTDGNRTKRYIVGSKGWKKRKITYFLSNWGDEIEANELLAMLEKAFKVWSDITPLNFTHVRSMEADLIIAFGRGHHGDRYAFDGQGNTLAHAFFPYAHGSYGGDIHFDDDEIWIDESKNKKKDGVDFFTVATHEIGHSLGLAHSTTPMSVMFPYYKGYNENFRIGYDDVLGMYDLYVRNEQFEDNYHQDENVRERESSTPEPKPATPDNKPIYPEYSTFPVTSSISNVPLTTPLPKAATTTLLNEYPLTTIIIEDPITTELAKTQLTTPITKPSLTTRAINSPKISPTSKTQLTTPVTKFSLTTPVYKPPLITKKPTTTTRSTYSQHPTRRQPITRKPTAKIPTRTVQPLPPLIPTRNPTTDRRPNKPVVEDGKIEANKTVVPEICQGPIEAIATLRNELFIFHKEYLWRMKDRGMIYPGYPVPIRSFFVGLPKSIKLIDAIYERPTDHYIIIFTGNQYWTFTGNRLTKDSPRPLRDLGLPDDLNKIDAAMVWAKNEKTYFFSGDKYWRYDDDKKIIEKEYPLEIKSRWLGIPTNIDSAFTWTDGQTYFLKGLQYWRFNNEAVMSDENFPRNSVEDWLGCNM